MRFLVFLGSLLAVAPISAQTRNQTDCASFTQAVTASEKAMAAEDADGVADNSAPRATMRELRINKELQLVAINLGLMARHGCAPRPYPVSTQAYMLPALECANAVMRRRLASDSSIPLECDRTRWRREVGGSAKGVDAVP